MTRNFLFFSFFFSKLQTLMTWHTSSMLRSIETKFSLTLNACVLSYKRRGNINFLRVYYLGYFIYFLRHSTDEMFTYLFTYLEFNAFTKEIFGTTYYCYILFSNLKKTREEKINDSIHTYIVSEKYTQNDFRSETPPMWCVQEGF